jgi:hypothetical protein
MKIMLKTPGWLVGCLLASQVAQAQESGQDPRVAEAKTACGAGEVKKGVRLLAELYTASNDPIWIFNQGRCYQQNDQLAQALARYKEFLRKSNGAPGEDLQDAKNYIAEITAELQRAQPVPTDTSSRAVEPAAAVSAQGQPAAPEARPGRGLRYLGLGACIAGGAALATGVVFTLLVRNTGKDIEAQTNKNVVNWSDVNGKYADGHQYETLQWVFYGVGAAAAVTGSVLYLIGSASAEPRASATRMFPVFMAGGAGAGLHMAF